ncbi:MAG: hypothetical protein ACYSVY_29130, partial [Planctomycetota bacterium]
SRLQVLRAQCEELGVPWDYRNKEATLEKRINDFRTRRVEEMDKMEEARKAEEMEKAANPVVDPEVAADIIADEAPPTPSASMSDEDLMGFRKTPDSAPEPQLAEGFGDPATPIGKAEQQAVIAMVEERSTHKQAEHYMPPRTKVPGDVVEALEYVSGFTIGLHAAQDQGAR